MSKASGIFEKQRQHHPKVRATTTADRIAKLRKLKEVIEASSEEIRKALHQDFRKAPSETDLTEIFPAISEINHTIKHLSSWMKPRRVKTPMSLMGTTSELRYEPKGVCLIIAPWNYPFNLSICPLIAAIAAGNCVVLKPSELTPETSGMLSRLLARAFPPEEVAVLEGGVDVSQSLLALPFDHIFFTGSTRVGKVVMEAASKHLASVTLELGGKSPAIVLESADIAAAAEKVVWGKCVNGGQTCVAPDYLLVPETKLQNFVEAAKKSLAGFYGPTEEDRAKHPDFCRIISDSHFKRLKGLHDDAVRRGAKAETGGVFKPEERYIAPTLLTGVSIESEIMAEEIFGPLLPILTYRSLDDALRLVHAKEKPLALYVFSDDPSEARKVLDQTTAGGSCVNSTLIHLANPNLPFGGVGPSGTGSYHGPFGFKAFSHERAVLKQGRIDGMKLMYPPYTPKVKKMIGFVTKYLA